MTADIEWAGDVDSAAALPFVTDVAGFDALARQAMRDDDADLVRDYLDFDGAEDMLRAVFGTGDVGTGTFLAAMRLVRVGLHPQDPGAAAVFDYALGRDLTDHVVAVTFDGTGRVRGVAVES
ncbi:DUF2004 domain-containing protein [Dactylosporangium sp. NBC_01737]|uniref:DUF2004 domain-containing protein n=1 Tax=Dactylosporangium sp. NBC_01737 TaxID=2975959 RepID=UPI002E0D548A|nr:DUF2004 domain-containing protein [Dactylosporangium sp. NBC_01737]